MQWFCIYTSPNGERLANEEIRKLGFETFLPVYLRIIVHANRRRPVLRPLFPRYLFVFFDLSGEIWPAIRRARGVEGILGCEGKPAKIPGHVVNRLQIWQQTGLFDQINKRVNPGDKVKILSGPFSEFAGEVCKADGARKRVDVLLNFLGRATRVTVPLAELQIICESGQVSCAKSLRAEG
jgi:transcriptional antiterminator RfaH